MYSDQDVARLLRLRQLTDAGRPIGMVAELEDHEATALLNEDRSSADVFNAGHRPLADTTDDWVERAFEMTLAFDAAGLDRVLRRSAMSLGYGPFLEDVATRLLHRIGSGWVAGEVTPAQEHMGTGVIERVLAWLVDSSGSGGTGSTLVVATLPGERHALGARLVATVAALEGWSVTYLGIELPVGEIASAAEDVGAVAVALSVVSGDALDETLRSLVVLREILDSSIVILVGGGASGKLGSDCIPPGVDVLGDLSGLRRALSSEG